MRHRPIGSYAPNQQEINAQVKIDVGFRCERCGHFHDPEHGFTLTVHHLDSDKSNNERWNLAALCQKCHLHIQSRVFLPQFYMLEHSDWLKPHLEGYYKSLERKGYQKSPPPFVFRGMIKKGLRKGPL